MLRLRIRKRNHIVLVLKAQKSVEIDLLIDSNDFDDMGYNAKLSRYRIRISNEDLMNRREALKELFLMTEKKYND